MEKEYFQKLKKRLYTILDEMPVDSQKISDLSCEIDNLIVEYYEKESYDMNHVGA